MSNEHGVIGYPMANGVSLMVPSAASVQYVLCGDHNCDSVHVFLLNERKIPFAECTIDEQMVLNILKVKAGERNDSNADRG